MSLYPDDNPEVLEHCEQRGYEDARQLASVVVPLCEDCAATLGAYRANTTIAMPKSAERFRAGWMRTWGEMHPTFKKEWPYT